MSEIEYLQWDSSFFGKKIGRLILTDENNFDGNRFVKEAEENFDLVYIFSLNKILSNQIVIMANLNLVDIMVTMSKPLDTNQSKENDYDFRTSLTEEEKNECYNIAEQTSIVSRFYKEPLIGPEKTKILYRKWIDNALNNTFSDGIFIQKENDRIIGIHLIKTDTNNNIGYFTLTGVDSNFKRSGVGKSLWNQSFGFWSRNNVIEQIKSPFSFQNRESLNFHLKMGFNKIEEIKYIYHFRTKHNDSL